LDGLVEARYYPVSDEQTALTRKEIAMAVALRIADLETSVLQGPSGILVAAIARREPTLKLSRPSVSPAPGIDP
jgi:hypothetical protein